MVTADSDQAFLILNGINFLRDIVKNVRDDVYPGKFEIKTVSGFFDQVRISGPKQVNAISVLKKDFGNG
jgi:hypothetical protein